MLLSKSDFTWSQFLSDLLYNTYTYCIDQPRAGWASRYRRSPQLRLGYFFSKDFYKILLNMKFSAIEKQVRRFLCALVLYVSDLDQNHHVLWVLKWGRFVFGCGVLAVIQEICWGDAGRAQMILWSISNRYLHIFHWLVVYSLLVYIISFVLYIASHKNL